MLTLKSSKRFNL